MSGSRCCVLRLQKGNPGGLDSPDCDTAGHASFRRRDRAWHDAVEMAAGSEGEFIKGYLRRSVEIEIMISLAGSLSAQKAMGLDTHGVGSGLVKLSPNEREMADNHGRTWDFEIVGGDLDYSPQLAEKVSGSEEEARA